MKYYFVMDEPIAVYDDVSVTPIGQMGVYNEEYIINNNIDIEILEGTISSRLSRFLDITDYGVYAWAVNKKVKEFLLSMNILKYTFKPLKLKYYMTDIETENSDYYEAFFCQTILDNVKYEIYENSLKERFLIIDSNSIPQDVDLFYFKKKYDLHRNGNIDEYYTLICSERFYKEYKKSKIKNLYFQSVMREDVMKDEIRKDEVIELRKSKYQFPTTNSFKENLKNWIELIFNEGQTWSKVKGLYFQITEHGGSYGVNVYGTKRFNRKNGDWALEEEIYFINDEIKITDEIINKMDWKECLDYLPKLIDETIKQVGTGKFKGGIGIGFADSEIKYI